jgi:hypothetical protein
LSSGGSLERDEPTLTQLGIKGEYAGNYHLMDEESTGGREFRQELPAYLHGFWLVRSKFTENPSNGNNSRISSSKSYILTIPNLKNLNMKTSLKSKINLIRPHEELHTYPIKSKKKSKIS